MNIGFGFCVFDCIWEHRLNVSLNMFSIIFEHFQKMSQKCEQFSYGPFVWDVLGFEVLMAPITSLIYIYIYTWVICRKNSRILSLFQYYSFMNIYYSEISNTKLQTEHWERKSIGKAYRPREGVSRHAQTSPHSLRNLQEVYPSLAGV